MHDEMADLYRRAQLAMAKLEAAVHAVVIGAGADGVTNADEAESIAALYREIANNIQAQLPATQELT